MTLPHHLSSFLIEDSTSPLHLERGCGVLDYKSDCGVRLYIHWGGGYRSVIAASLFKRQGIHNLRNVLGGWNKIKNLKKVG